MGRLISSWLRLPGAAWAPLPRGSCLLTLSAQPGGLAGSEQGSQPWGELQASNTQGQGAGEELEAMPRIWGSGGAPNVQEGLASKIPGVSSLCPGVLLRT